MGRAWYPYHAAMAGWLSAWMWHWPEPDYMGHWMAQAMRSDVLPGVAGW